MRACDNSQRYRVLIAGPSAIGGSFQQVSFSLLLHLMSLKLVFYLPLLLMAVVFGAVLCAPCSLSALTCNKGEPSEGREERGSSLSRARFSS